MKVKLFNSVFSRQCFRKWKKLCPTQLTHLIFCQTVSKRKRCCSELTASNSFNTLSSMSLCKQLKRCWRLCSLVGSHSTVHRQRASTDAPRLKRYNERTNAMTQNTTPPTSQSTTLLGVTARHRLHLHGAELALKRRNVHLFNQIWT